jgi:hypothetical protein
MEKLPTAEELILKTGSNEFWDNFSEVKKQLENAMIEFAKLHVEAALKAAGENAKITERKKVIDNTGGYIRIPTIYKKHILNSYPLKNVK